MKQAKQTSLFDSPEPPTRAEQPQETPIAIAPPPHAVAVPVASDAERDRQSYAALVEYI